MTTWITGTGTDRAAPLLRAEFDVPDGARALLRVAALGYADVTINGEPASPDRLVPGQTQYDRAVGVVEWDVTGFLGERRWTVGVALGRGFFDMEVPSAWDWHLAPWRARPALWLELEVDGHIVASSDQTWRTSTGGTTFDSLYEGESFDESLEPDGWRLSGFADSAWPNAQETSYDGELRPVAHPPVRVVGRHAPAWRRVGENRWIGDVGRVIAGWVYVGADLPVELEIIHSERLDQTGEHALTGNIHVASPRFQTDRVRTASPWEARFTYKGFRYLEVTGIDDPRQLVTAVEAHADVQRTGEFTSSHPTLKWWHDAFTDTVLANLHHVPTDTPTYEKNGWVGDAQISARAILHTLDAGSILEKFLDDLTDGQRPDGQLPVIAPTAHWGYDGECAPAPEWTIALPVIALELAEETGDASLLARHTPAIRAWLERELSLLDADGLAVGVLGDYLSPGTPGPPPEDIRFYSTASLAHALRRLAATQLDLDPGLRELAATAGPRLADSLNRAFLEWEPAPGPDTVGEAKYVTSPEYRQAPSVLALAWDLAPASSRDALLQRLLADLEARDWHHNLGCIGGSELYGLLARQGHADVAVRLAAHPTAPSFEAWRLAGHSTLLEHWGPIDRSHAHYFQGAGVKWLYEDLAGLRRSSPGWTTFEVVPRFPESVHQVSFRRRTPLGTIEVGWHRDGAHVVVDVEVIGAMRGTLLLDGIREDLEEGHTSRRIR